MKKLSKNYLLWLKGKNKRLWSKFGGRGNRYFKVTKSTREKKLIIPPLVLPECLSLDNSALLVELILVISKIKNRVLIKYFSPIDFRQIREVTPSGALIVAAELDRLRLKRQMKLKPWKLDEWNDEVRRVFDQFKLFDLLSISSYKEKDCSNADCLKFVPLSHSTTGDGLVVKNFLGNDLTDIIGEELLSKKKWFTALSEAITNVTNHAYTERKRIDLHNAWWLSGSYHTENKTLTVMFYDQGRTIPKTLPASSKWEKLKELFPFAKADGDLIKAAFEVGRSSTNNSYRGKGVAQLLQPLEECNNGMLRVISNYGECKVTYKNKQQVSIKVKNYSAALEGTFIEWQLDLS